MELRLVVILACLGLVQAKVMNLSCKQIRRFVVGHNSRRLLLAKGQVEGHPAASQMKAIIWDEELADKAAKWASGNVFQHNPDRNIASKRFTTGENIYIYTTTRNDYELDPDSALKSWFDEYKNFSYKPLANSDFGGANDIGHYTQMAWSDSIYLGCAISQYQSTVKGKEMYNFLVVCNYGPGGNFIGQTPYQSGKASGKLICGGSDCKQRYGKKC